MKISDVLSPLKQGSTLQGKTMEKLLYVQDGKAHEHPVEDNFLKDFNLEVPLNGASDVWNFITNNILLGQYWTRGRENDLNKYAIETDFIASTINILVAKMANLPISVRPRNKLIRKHQELAKDYKTILTTNWNEVCQLFLVDMLTHDMGGALLVKATNSPSQAMGINDFATGLEYIPWNEIQFIEDADSQNRPYIWYRQNESAIRLHKSKIIRLFQTPRRISKNIEVGQSFTSRAFNVANLMRYAVENGLENLGALDATRIIWATSTTGQSVKSAFKEARIEATNAGAQRSGGNVYVGLKDPSGRIGILDVNRLPPGFSYQEYTSVTIKLMAFAAGVDEDDIVPSTNAGTTKTATLISDLKSQFKLVAWFSKFLVHNINEKFLPKDLEAKVGDEVNDINESEAKARMSYVRSEALLEKQGIYSKRTVRKHMTDVGAMSEDNFMLDELEDYRLTNGLSVQTLFLSKDQVYQRLLAVEGFDYCLCQFTPELIEPVKKQIIYVEEIAANTNSDNIFRKAIESIAALKWVLHEIEHQQGSMVEKIDDNFNDGVIARHSDDESEENQNNGQDNDKNASSNSNNNNVSQDSNNEQFNNQNNNQNKEKSYMEVPTTSAQRELRSNVRQVVRKMWEGVLTKEELIEQARMLGVRQDWLEMIVRFIDEQNMMTKENGVKLKELYEELHAQVLDDLLDEI